jgi:hypothetical protein
MKHRLVLSLAFIFSTTACTLRVPGLNLGPLGASSSSSRSSSSGASEAPALIESSATRAWRAVLDNRQLEEQLTDLHERLEDQPKEGSTSPDQHAEWTLKFMKNDKLGEVAKGCAAGTFKGEELKLEGRKWLKADAICPLVIDREALLKKQVHAWGVAICDRYFWEMGNRINDIEKDGRVSVGLLEQPQSAQKMKDYVASFAKKTFEAIGEQVPPEALAKADELFKRQQDVILKLAAAGKIDRSVKPDPGAEKAIRDVYARRFEVKSVIMRDGDWKVVRNDFGVLLRHYKNADVLVKAKDGSFCALVPASVGQQYEDMGKYSNAYGVDEYLQGRPVKCP